MSCTERWLICFCSCCCRCFCGRSVLQPLARLGWSCCACVCVCLTIPSDKQPAWRRASAADMQGARPHAVQSEKPKECGQIHMNFKSSSDFKSEMQGEV